AGALVEGRLTCDEEGVADGDDVLGLAVLAGAVVEHGLDEAALAQAAVVLELVAQAAASDDLGTAGVDSGRAAAVDHLEATHPVAPRVDGVELVVGLGAGAGSPIGVRGGDRAGVAALLLELVRPPDAARLGAEAHEGLVDPGPALQLVPSGE